MKTDSKVVIARANDASYLLNDKEFIEQWKLLYDNCTWTTVFQSVEFVTTWFNVYEDYAPVIIYQYGENNALRGLLVLAIDSMGLISFAGTHHAEYKAWLQSEDADDFIGAAFKLLIHNSPDFTLQMSYVKDVAIIDRLKKHMGEYVLVSKLSSYVKLIDEESVNASLKKKGNKSKVNRLNKTGEVVYRKVESYDEFYDYLEICSVYHDIRQGAMNDSFPFVDDKNKLKFHVELFKANAELLHVTVLLVDSEPEGVHIGYRYGEDVLYSINAYNPMLPRYSLGKVIFLLLSKHFLQDGITHFDLSPGDDAWKQSFSNKTSEAFEVVIYSSKYKKIIKQANNGLRNIIKLMLSTAGINWRKIIRRRISAEHGNSHTTDKLCNHDVYQLTDTAAFMSEFERDEYRNNLPCLVNYDVTQTGMTRQVFMQELVARISGEEIVYSCGDNENLKCFAWQNEAPHDVVQGMPDGTFVAYSIHCCGITDQDEFNKMLQTIAMDGSERYEHLYLLIDPACEQLADILKKNPNFDCIPK